MAFHKIPSKNLGNLSLFGFQIIEEDDDLILVEDREGEEVVVYKKDPWIWFDDPEDAMQLGSTGIITRA